MDDLIKRNADYNLGFDDGMAVGKSQAADTLERMREALEKARHRLLKEGFAPEDPTVQTVIQALQETKQ